MRNPSAAQKKASKANLKNHEGPKTTDGKKRSAANGIQSRGAISAKGKAIQLLARRKASDQRKLQNGLAPSQWKASTLYDIARCAEGCPRVKPLPARLKYSAARLEEQRRILECEWPSFAVDTPHDLFPIACYGERVLSVRPELCFYNVYGKCAAPYMDGGVIQAGYKGCFIEPNFIKELEMEVVDERLKIEAERINRKSICALKERVERGLKAISRAGLDVYNPSKGTIDAINEAYVVLNICGLCRYNEGANGVKTDVQRKIELLNVIASRYRRR